MPTRREFIAQSTAAGLGAAVSIRGAQAFAIDESARAGDGAVMESYTVPGTDLAMARIGYGCMQVGGSWNKQQPLAAETVVKAEQLIHTAYDNGITLYDHADLYCFGKSEEAFGRVLKRSPGLREKILIQSKCGIRFPENSADPNDIKRFDSSRTYILKAVEGSLRRLDTDRLDILLLHRPDALAQPEEVARAFDELHDSGKVRYFGVSNHTPWQMELLRKSIRQPLVANQIHLSLLHLGAIADGMESGLDENERITHVYTGIAGTLDYCRLHGIQVQAYSTLRGVLYPGEDASPETKAAWQLLQTMAKDKNTSPGALALAWLLRHPAGILTLTGTTNPEHVADNCTADGVELTGGEWYRLFCAGAGISPNKL